MFRLLIIGKEALLWGEKFLAIAPNLIIDTARLPAAGVRQFHETPADALVILAKGDPPRTLSLIRTIRELPLGEWAPIVILYDFESTDETPDIIASKLTDFDVNLLLSVNAEPKVVLTQLEEELGFSPGELASEQQSVVTLQTIERARDIVADDAPLLEEMSEPNAAFVSPSAYSFAYGRQGDEQTRQLNHLNDSFRRDATRVASLRQHVIPHESDDSVQEFEDEEATTQISQIPEGTPRFSVSAPPVTNPSVTPPKAPTRIETSAYIIEHIVDPSDEFAPQETRVATARPPKPPPAMRRTGHPKAPAMVAMQGPVNEHAIRDMLQCVRKQPYYDILGLTPDEVREDLELVSKAHLFLSRRFDPRHVDLKYSRNFLDELNEIRDAVDDAYAVMSNQELREEYFLALKK